MILINMYKEGEFTLEILKEECVLKRNGKIIAKDITEVLLYFGEMEYNPHLDEYDIEDLENIFRAAILENGCCIVKGEE